MAEKPTNLLAGIDPTPLLVSDAEHSRDHLAARQLLRMASECILEGKPVPEGMRAWLSRGLQMMSEGTDAKLAFKHVPKSGRPPQHSEEFERLVAEHIHYSNTGRHKALSSDGTCKGAYSEAKKAYGISENTAEKFYKKHIDNILMEQEIRQKLTLENETD